MQSPSYTRLYTHGPAQIINKATLFRGLYQGVFSVIIATLPSSGAFFITYEHTKTLLSRLDTTTIRGRTEGSQLLPTPLMHALASSTAELVSCAILTPAEVIKQNAQMVDSSSASSTNATLQTLKKFQAQPAALWRGYAALAGRNLPFTALQFPMFEKLKEGWREWRGNKRSDKESLMETGIITGCSAGFAGALAAVVTTPVDVVKTRIMLSAGEKGGIEKSVNKGTKGLVDAVGKRGNGNSFRTVMNSGTKGRKSGWVIGKDIVAEQGLKGLWRGGALRGVWTFLGSGLYLGTYESGRIWLASRRGERVKEATLF